jgi:excisionase family DNA binding protein
MNSSSVTTIQELAERLDRIEALTLLGAKNTLDIDEAALYTGYSKGHLYRLTSLRQIPHSKRDRKLYFDKATLDRWMTEVSVPTQAAVEAAADKYISTHKH